MLSLPPMLAIESYKANLDKIDPFCSFSMEGLRILGNGGNHNDVSANAAIRIVGTNIAAMWTQSAACTIEPPVYDLFSESGQKISTANYLIDGLIEILNQPLNLERAD